MYKNSFTRKNPGLVVILLNQSESMSTTNQNNGLTLAENAANSVNNLINELIMKLTTTNSSGEEIVKPSVQLVIIGYGGPNDEAYIICSDMIDKIADTYPIGKVKMCTREGLFEQDCIEILQPVADGKASMDGALLKTKEFILDWSISHNTDEDPVPVVINVTGGECIDHEQTLISIARDIMNVNFSDGKPRIFNIHLSTMQNDEQIDFPKDNEKCPDSYSKLLYELSSEIETDFVYCGLAGGERCLIYNHNNFIYPDSAFNVIMEYICPRHNCCIRKF